MITLIITGLISVCTLPAEASSSDRQYLNLWIAEVRGGEEVARRVARDNGFKYNGPYDPFEDHYEFTRDDHPEVSPRHSQHLSSRLMDLHEVEWAEQQSVVKMSLRGNIPDKPVKEQVRSGSGRYSGEVQKVVSREPKKKAGSFDKIPKNRFSTKPAEKSSLDLYFGPTSRGTSYLYKTSPYVKVFNDPHWSKQWYVHDYRTWNGPVFDHNVVPVYELGYTGQGMTVMVVDSGIEGDHPDIKENFLEGLSYDFCKRKPGSVDGSHSGHGTKCAGVIAMVADNGICGVGIAYNAKIAAARVTECLFGSTPKALVSNLDQVDVYSCSFGPDDNGMLMDKVGRMRDKSITMGIEEGRKGKGAIYVFAAGNGRRDGDNCAADGAVNHIGVIGISSADRDGKPTWFGERCSAVVATAYSGNSDRTAAITTTFRGDCIHTFSGTSASTPIAAGIITLVLQSKPGLSYRDVMHLIAWTSEVAPLANNEDSWYRNGRGIWVSNDFGFGLLNAENMVIAAKDWENVPKKKKCVIQIQPKKPVRFRTAQYLNITIDTKACQGKIQEEVLYLEQIELTSTVEYPYRGALKIFVTSPAGTETLLLEPRLRDKNKFGLYEWIIKSVHNWGEDPRGKWTISVLAISLIGFEDAEAVAHKFTLTLHGTSDKPAHYNLPRRYAAFRLPDGSTPWTKYL